MVLDPLAIAGSIRYVSASMQTNGSGCSEGNPVGGRKTRPVTRSAENDSKPSEATGLVWLRCDDSVTTAGIAHVLQGQTQVHVGVQAPERTPSCVIICAEGTEDLASRVEEARYPDVPVLIFGLYADLLLARAALSAGTQGFIHAGMSPDHLLRAIEVAIQGEPVLPRALLLQLVAQDGSVALDKLSARQREVLELAADGLSNAQIAQRLHLSEATIKQHLSGAYRLLGVKNRVEATRLIRSGY